MRFDEEDVHTTAIGTADKAWRRSDVETWFYGVAVTLEPEIWVSSSVALVGRLGAGVYGYDADGEFSSSSTLAPDPFAARITDDDSGAGFRGLLGAGIKVKLSSTMTLTGYADADYYSHVGSADLPDNQFTSATTSRVATDDAWELRAGTRLSVGFDSGP